MTHLLFVGGLEYLALAQQTINKFPNACAFGGIVVSHHCLYHPIPQPLPKSKTHMCAVVLWLVKLDH